MTSIKEAWRITNRYQLEGFKYIDWALFPIYYLINFTFELIIALFKVSPNRQAAVLYSCIGIIGGAFIIFNIYLIIKLIPILLPILGATACAILFAIPSGLSLFK